MRPEIRSISSSDVDDLDKWVPDTLEAVNFPLGLLIGPPDEFGTEIFYVQIATPEAIRARSYLGNSFFARHYLIVREYDWPSIVDQVKQRVAQCEGDTWAEMSLRLSRWFAWEFEDYQSYNPDDTQRQSYPGWIDPAEDTEE